MIENEDQMREAQRDWLLEVLASKPDLKPTSWAKKADLTPTTVTRRVNPKDDGLGLSLIKPATIAKLARAAGVPVPSFAMLDAVAQNRPSNPEPDYLSVPEFDIQVSAGGGYYIDREDVKDHWPLPRRYLIDELRLQPDSLSMVEVRGDSMEPLLRTGDRVIVNHADTNAAAGGVYVIWDGNATVVKRVEKVPYSDPPMLVLISENKAHNQYTVHAELVNVVGRVVWVARRM